MKKLFLYILLVCVLSGLVSAALTMPTEVSLGGSSQVKSNPDEEDEYAYATRTFTITNTVNSTVTNIVFSSTAASSYNVTFSPSSIASLAGLATQTVTVRAKVPENLDTFFPARTDANTERSLVIGNIVATAGSLQSTSILDMEAENNLAIKRIYVQINSGSNKRFDDGDSVEDIRPGDKLTIQVVVENQYSDNDNIDFDNVEVDIQSDDSDFDVDDTLDFGSISSDSEKTKTLTYTVDSDIDEDTYTVDFVLTGEDDYGSIEGAFARLDFEVTKEDQDIAIKSATISPETVKCDRDATISVRLENVGSDDSDEIVLQWESTALGIKNQQLQINMDSGDDFLKSISVPLPESQKAGTYTFRLTTYFDFDAYEDRDINNYAEVQLKVEDCVSIVTCYACIDSQIEMQEYEASVCPSGWSATIPKCEVVLPVEPEKNTTVVTPPTTNIPTGAVPAPVTYKSSTNDMLYIGLIGLGYLFVLIVGIALIAYALKRR